YISPLEEQIRRSRPLESLRIAHQFDERGASPRRHHVKHFGGRLLDPCAANLDWRTRTFRCSVEKVGFLADTLVQHRAEARALAQQDGQHQTGETGAASEIHKVVCRRGNKTSELGGI